MAKDDRRRQLLAVALEIVRTEGTETLTLARLAERARVTKPIAYDHFVTRRGLLMALFHEHDQRTAHAVGAALAAGPKTIDEVASILSRAFVDCVLEIGPEFSAILDALSASEETGDFRQAWREALSNEFRKAFAPFTSMPAKAMRPLLAGVLGAAEALSQAAATKRLSRVEAVAALTRLMTGALKAG
jgi:AcrR family transcriptional regulator